MKRRYCMKTRWMTLTLVLVMAVAVMAAGPGITKANFDLIKKDMKIGRAHV